MSNQDKEWEIHLTYIQRVFCTMSNVIVLGVIPLMIEAYILCLFFVVPNYYFLYVPAFLIVVYVHYISCKPEKYEAQSADEQLIVRIENGSLYYGVSGREFDIDFPVSMEKGLFGCVNLKFGPIYYFPLPKIIALDSKFINALEAENLLANANSCVHPSQELSATYPISRHKKKKLDNAIFLISIVMAFLLALHWGSKMGVGGYFLGGLGGFFVIYFTIIVLTIATQEGLTFVWSLLKLICQKIWKILNFFFGGK